MKIIAIMLSVLLEVIPSGKAFLRQIQPRDSILIADQLEYGFRLDGVSEGTVLALPDFGILPQDTLAVVRGWQLDTLTKKRVRARTGRMDISASLVIAPFEEGEYHLPPIPVQRTLDGAVDTLLFDPDVMEVHTMPVDTAAFEINDIKGQIGYPVTMEELLPWFVAARLLLFVAALAGAILYVRRRKSRGDASVSRDPAHIVALRELDRFRSDKFWAPEKQKTFYSGVTDALKNYIDSRFGIDAPEMTTAELFAALKSGKELSPEMLAGMQGLFERADFVKFAKYVASDEDNASVLPLAVRFVTETYRSEIEGENDMQGGGEAARN